MAVIISSRKRLYAFIIIWIAYASTYFLRKPFGVIKKSLSSDLSLSESQLGWLDASFLLPYAMVQMFIGSIGDRCDAVKTVAFALICSAFSMMGFSQVTSIYSLAIFFFLNGFAQSLCWPAGCKVVGCLYDGPTKNNMFGIYSTSMPTGAFVSTFLAVFLQDSFGYTSVFPICATIVGIVGLLVGCSVPVNTLSIQQTDIITNQKVTIQKPRSSGMFGFFRLFKLNLVIELCILWACLKLIRYSIYMWLPMYLSINAGYTEANAGMVSTFFDLGGLIGNLIVGPITNRLFNGKAIHTTTLFTLLSTGAFIGFILTSNLPFLNAMFLLLAGVFITGPDGLICGALSTEIGDKDGRNLGSAVTGLVNGFGGIGAVAEGPLIGWISQTYGWNFVFPCMVLISILATAISAEASYIVHKETKLSTTQEL